MPLDILPPRSPRLAATVERVGAPPIPACRDWAARYDGRHGPLLDLTHAVPGGPPQPELLRRIAAAAGDPDHAHYGPLEGEPALRESFAAETRRLHGGDVRAGDVRITAGANTGFNLAMTAIAAPGDEVIVPTPWFFNHPMSLALRGVVARPLPPGPRFLPDPDAAAALVGPRTRAIVLVSPNNPTGAAFPAALVARFAAMCRLHGLWLVLDETYRDFLPPGHGAPHGLFARPDWRDFAVQLHSFSKAHGIPGHRLGAVVAGPAFGAAFMKAVDNIQICPPRPPQAGLAWALPNGRLWRAARAAAVAGTGAAFAAALGGISGLRVESQGAFFLWVRIPEAAPDARAVAEALASRHGLVSLPGCCFGPGNERHLRLSFARLDAASIPDAARRLAEFARSPEAGLRR